MTQKKIAYFSMEIGLKAEIPTYSGGLGVLAGDTIKSAADAGLPMVAVTLLYRKGYFHQQLSATGQQTESPVMWNIEDHLKPIATKLKVQIAGRDVHLRAWRYDQTGEGGDVVPVYFLDSELAENDPRDQRLTDHLYGGDSEYRLSQEIILGMGGVALLKGLGELDGGVATFHMNEGHAALLTLSLAQQFGGEVDLRAAAEQVKGRCVFTTHTPVAAGHDRFGRDLVEALVGHDACTMLEGLGGFDSDGLLNMTHLALHNARYTNGVAKRHGDVSRGMFPGSKIDSITNGVHAASWTAAPMQELFCQRAPNWRRDQTVLRELLDCPVEDIAAAHLQSKKKLVSEIERLSGVSFEVDTFTIGFARRAASYKRADLLLHDPDRLVQIAKAFPKGIQIVYAGKSHPKDDRGRSLITNVHQGREVLSRHGIELVYLENYDMDLGLLLTSGVDIWLNNPVKPFEASGTSGMKAALNGVPSLSTLDGWWVEGCIDGVTGWEIPDAEDGRTSGNEAGTANAEVAGEIYRLLENTLLPMFYESPDEFAKIRRQAIALNGSHFTTQRMVGEYAQIAYR